MTAPTTVAGALTALDAGRTTSAELVGAAILAADQDDDTLGVFITRTSDAARAAAAESDRRRTSGALPRALEGIPIGIKDIIATGDVPATGQSSAQDLEWSARVGAATVVQRLRDAGAIVVGTTTTMEYAAGIPDASRPFPVPRNPWDTERWAGGSSSGSASGVVAGMFLCGIGTDTGGSVRIPSAFCGATGIKPT